MILDAEPLRVLTPQYFQDFFELAAQLFDDLLTLRDVRLRIIAGQLLPSTADGKAFIVKKAAYLPDYQDILTLVIASVAAPLYRLKLREFLLPVPQHMWLYGA